MSLVEGLSLFGIMVALAAMPSASVALVVTRAATLGTADGLAAAAGIVLGDLAFVLLAMLGLAVVAETMGSVFMIVKYLGAGYLLWLGCRLLASADTIGNTASAPRAGRCSLVAGFLAGFALTLGDIKAVVFYVSLFPVVLDLSALRTAGIVAVTAVTVVGVGGVKALYAVTARQVASAAGRWGLDRAARRTAGVMMLGAGGYLAVKT